MMWSTEDGSTPVRACDHPCQVCGVRAQHAHHKLPRSRGGTDDPLNIAFLCAECHAGVHAHPRQAMKLGLTIQGFILYGRYWGPNREYRRRFGGAA